MRSKTFIISIVFVLFLSCNKQKIKPLPIYNPANLNKELVDKSLRSTSKNHTVLDFNLINQNGQIITQDNYKGKIYVTDFFFTSCGTICPTMTNNMFKIQKAFLNNPDVMFLSISVTPTIDSVPVLHEYAKNKGVIDVKWNVTTGNKKHIYNLARKSYFAVVEKGDGGLQDFIHTPNFILVDTKKQIRGIYDGTNNDDVKRIISDIKILRN
ncbi:SCO family protein [Lacinutrix sp. Bg11-31]|uniref:SCO family protein n=1 Tax=Lacinutrix sp. Bg11-31 TaxID=2057808 RepID=UPI000C3029C1|nr:SCO family protein [Lacinutrix sp. Bg11-31]AUC81020.1 SCO family protein [Lacinutrix sp. Bg11-31]